MKATHCLKDPKSLRIYHYLNEKHPHAFRRFGETEWRDSPNNLFEYCKDSPGDWILERLKPVALENK